MKKRTKPTLCILVAAAFLLTGCRKTPEMEFDTADAAKQALNTAETIEIYSDLYSSSAKTKIVADGKVAGYLKGNTVYIDNQEWFHIDSVEDQPVNYEGGNGFSITYGYYDKDNNCLGYAQKRYLDTEDVRDEFLVFLDTDYSMLDYFSSRSGTALYDGDGSTIGTGHAGREGVGLLDKYYTNLYCTVFKTEKEAGAVQNESPSIRFMDRMAMYECLQDDYRRIYDDPVNTGVQIFETIAVILVLFLSIGTVKKKKDK